MASTSLNTSKTLKTKPVARAIGRRREAVASVYLHSGAGEITVNGQSADKYFPGVLAKSRYTQPFATAGVTKYSASVKTHGGGKNGQLDATVLGISRALVTIKDAFRSPLRNAGLLTRDSRERQRRNVGTGGKARRKKQSPKR